MPGMVEEDLIVPDLAQAFIHQPKRQLVGAADVTQIIEMLIGAADRDEIGAAGAKAGAVVAGV